MIKLTDKELKSLLQSVAQEPKDKQILSAFLKGIEYALTGKIPVQKQPVLFQPKTN